MYVPGKVPLVTDNDAISLAQFLEDEFKDVARALREDLELDVIYVAPLKPRAGLVVYADGTTWNPGDGEGLYVYTQASTWVKLNNNFTVANFGAWTAFTPTITAFTGTFTSVSGQGRYNQIGKLVFFSIEVDITTNGTAAGSIIATVPVAAKANGGGFFPQVFAGRENAITGTMMLGFFNDSTHLYMQKYDGTYLGANGYKPCFSGVYEAA